MALSLVGILAAGLLVVISFTLLVDSTSGVKESLRDTAHVVEYNQTSLLHAISRKDTCTVVCVGATWDGHFKVWVNREAWKKLAQSLQSHYITRDVEVGYFLYNEHPIPSVLEEIWHESPPSYDIKVFKSGILLRNYSLEQELRSAYPSFRYDIWRDVTRLCLHAAVESTAPAVSAAGAICTSKHGEIVPIIDADDVAHTSPAKQRASAADGAEREYL